MADQWFFARDGEKLGPFSAAQLLEFVTGGRLRPHDTVWKEGVERGVLASRVKHLFASTHLDVPAVLPLPTPPPSPRLAQQPILEDLPLEADDPSPSTLDVPDEIGLAPLWEAAPDSDSEDAPPPPKEEAPKHREPPPEKKRTPRVLGVKGGVMISQNDGVLRYRKKCSVCGHMDPSVANARIRSGVTRVTHFCTKCRKSRQIEIQVV